MSKSVKTILAVAVAVAIPFAAPAIAGSIAASAGLSAAGATLGSAAVGAGLGAVGAKLTGGDVGRGALMGAIGGGIGGYTSATAPAAAAPAAASGSSISPDVLAAANASSDPIAALSASQGYGADPAYLASIGYTGPVAAPVAVGLSSVPVDASAGFTSGISETAAIEGAGVAGTNIPTGVAAGAAAAPVTFADAILKVPGEIAAKFSDPKALADLTLRAAGSIAGSLAAGDGMSDQEKQLLQAQTDELRALQQSNKALFDQKLQAAQDLIGESKYFDPEYFGLQRARRAQLAGAKAKQAGLRGLTGSRRASEERRLDLATGRDTGTAFDQGFLGGLSGRMQTAQAGLSAMPAYPSAESGFTNLRAAYGAANTRRRDAVSDFGKLYGSFTGTANARSVADIRKELAEAEARA